MKRTSGSFKRASDLSESVHQRLNMYTLAASAAGVSLLFSAQISEAKILYTPTHAVIGRGGVNSYNLDLNHDGIVDLAVQTIQDINRCPTDNDGLRRRIFDTPASGNGVEGAPLSQGSRIGHSQNFYGSQRLMVSSVYAWGGGHSCRHFGRWWSVTNRYLGVEFKIHNKIHYGWARLTFDRGRTATLTGYAYETIVGKSIIAGKTHDAADGSTLNPDSADPDEFGTGVSLTNPIPDTPQPASLGMLALGAQGVPLWRRKESAACISETMGSAKAKGRRL
jgi:hypothetical protein